MPKVHLRIARPDSVTTCNPERYSGRHTACGFVRDKVTLNNEDVTCKHCLHSEHMTEFVKERQRVSSNG